MTGPDDTIPPTPAKEVPPDPASNAALPVIPRGDAQRALAATLDRLAIAFVDVEAVAMALARQLDSADQEGAQ